VYRPTLLFLCQAYVKYCRVVQELGLDEDRFRRYFRMSPATFDYLLSLIADKIVKKSMHYTGRSPGVAVGMAGCGHSKIERRPVCECTLTLRLSETSLRFSRNG